MMIMLIRIVLILWWILIMMIGWWWALRIMVIGWPIDRIIPSHFPRHTNHDNQDVREEMNVRYEDHREPGLDEGPVVGAWHQVEACHFDSGREEEKWPRSDHGGVNASSWRGLCLVTRSAIFLIIHMRMFTTRVGWWSGTQILSGHLICSRKQFWIDGRENFSLFLILFENQIIALVSLKNWISESWPSIMVGGWLWLKRGLDDQWWSRTETGRANEGLASEREATRESEKPPT